MFTFTTVNRDYDKEAIDSLEAAVVATKGTNRAVQMRGEDLKKVYAVLSSRINKRHNLGFHSRKIGSLAHVWATSTIIRRRRNGRTAMPV
jgi:hypothetical protein